MIIREMHYDQLMKFQKCLINNGNGTFSVNTTPGATGTSTRASYRRDVMENFHKTITVQSPALNSVRII